MSKEILVKEFLSKEMIAAGHNLIKKLGAHIDISVGLWLFFPEKEKWKLIIASHDYDKLGPIAIYEKVQKAIAELDQEYEIDLSDVLATDLDHEFIAPIIVFTKKSRVKLGNNRLGKTTINGVFFEDGYLYKVKA